jgi:cell division protein FtsQ
VNETLAEIKRRERQKKIEQARRKQRIRLAFAGLTILVIFLILIFFLNSDYFKIKIVNFNQTLHVSQKKIDAVSSHLKGKNLFRAPFGKVRELLLSDPWVKEVQIKRKFPDEVQIKIVERKPVAQVALDGFYYLIAEDGMVLEKKANPEDLIQIADLPVKKLTPGKILKSQPFESAMKVYRSLSADLKKKVLVISAPSSDKIIFYLGGVEVIFGQPEYLEEKLMILKEILKREGSKAISVDLRVPDNPVVKTQP